MPALGRTIYGGHDGKSLINWRLEDGREGHVSGLHHIGEDTPNVKTLRRVIDQETGEVLAEVVFLNGELLSEHPRPVRDTNPNRRIKVVSGWGDSPDMWLD
jgi:hypothetical protein